MSKLNWDFRYIESRSKSGLRHSHYSTSVAPDAYVERLQTVRQSPRINPWLCIAVIVGCVYLLWKVVAG